MGTYKKAFLVVVALVVQIFCSVQPVAAIDYDVDKLGAFLFVPEQSYALKSDGELMYFQGGSSLYNPGVNISTTLNVVELHMKFDRTIPKNSMLNFYVKANAKQCLKATEYGGSCKEFDETPFVIKAYGGKAYLYETEVLSYVTEAYNNRTTVIDSKGNYEVADRWTAGMMAAAVYNIKMITTQDVDELVFSFNTPPTGYLQMIPGSYIGLSDVGGGINNVSEALDKQNEQHEKEIEDQQSSVDDSKTSADDSQKDVESGSASFLDVLSQVIGVLVSAKATNCVLHMTYGDYFDAPLDLCALDPPPLITSLTSIIVVFMMYGLAKSVISQIVQIIGSFQR